MSLSRSTAVGGRRAKLLVVDDDATLARSAARALLQDHDVTATTSVTDALRELSRNTFDAVLCDVHMPDGGGVAVWQAILRTQLRLGRRVVFMTSDPVSVRVLGGLPNRVLKKPFTLVDLRECLADEVRLARQAH